MGGMRGLGLARVLAGAALVCGLADAAVAQDKVVPLQGATASGKVAELTRDQVSIEVRGKTQNYKVNEIRKVSFGDDPAGLDRARDFANDRNFNQALDELKKIDASGISNPLVLQDYQFYRGWVEGRMSLAGEGDKAAAASLLMAVKKANPNSHHTYRLNELLGELAVGMGRGDVATNYYRELAASPFPEVKALAFFRQGELELGAGRIPEARKLFEQLASSSANDAEMIRLKNLAEVGLAVCAAREGKSEEALTKLRELVLRHDSSDHQLFARIYNAQGTCLEALGKPNQAILAYLHTDLLFSGSAELHAEALYRLSQLWPAAGQPQRAATARQRLVTLYPSSSWANKQ
jgi:tetratricopeptide (TPR) repeat protein